MTLENLSSFYTSLPLWALVIILIWSLVWKGLALWKSSRKNSPIWFVILLVVNTLGILEILYLFIFSELKKKPKNAPTSKKASKSKASSRARR